MKRIPIIFQKYSHTRNMPASSEIIYEFADFRLIPSEGLLLQLGKPVPLSLKAFSTLVLLVERHDHLVAKSELIETVWSDSFVEEAAVSRCVWTIRHALGEDPKSQRFIKTFPKRGYKFIAEVNVLRASGGVREGDGGIGMPIAVFDTKVSEPQESNTYIGGEPTPRSENRHKPASVRERFRQGYVFAISAVLLIAAGMFAIYVSYPGTAALSGGGPVTIAVLPFEPINAANRDELYDVGIADALINRLSTIENFQVRSLSSVRRYADLETDAIAAGIEQKAEYVLVSRYQLVGGKIRITAQLIDIGAGRIVEAYDFQKEAPSVFTAQDAIAIELEDRLASKLGGREGLALSERGTKNEEAYRYYLLAQNFNEIRGPENGRIALERIDQALAFDPNFARAWATKAYIHRYLAYGADAIEHSLRSIEAVEKAIAIDPNLSEAHSTLCFNKLRFEYDFDSAERACRRAIELDPNSPLAHKLYSNFLYTRGRFDEAITEIKKAIDLQPVSYDNQQTYALALYFARRYPESETQWKQLIPLNPNHNLIYGQLVKALVQQGKEPEALEHMIKLLSLENEDEDTIKRFRAAFTKSGWRGAVIERIKLVESRRNTSTYELARLNATIGEKNNAFKYLERAYEERSNMIAIIEVDPELDPLRDDPRYAQLLRRLWPNR